MVSLREKKLERCFSIKSLASKYNSIKSHTEKSLYLGIIGINPYTFNFTEISCEFEEYDMVWR